MAYYGEDEWDRPRRPAARHQYSDQYYLDPNARYRGQGSLHRTRSQGHSPAPIVNVYNDVLQESNQRAQAPSVPGAFPAPYPPSPESRGRRGMADRLGEELLADELAELRLERRMRSRSRGDYYERDHSRDHHGRSRSRGRSDVSSNGGRSEFYKYEMDRLEREKRELEQRDQWKREKSRIEAELEIKRLKEDAQRAHDEDDREAERKKLIADYERKQREAADKAKAEEQRITEKVEREKREAADRAKAEEQRIKEKLEREEREAKEKEKREWQEFERRQKEKKEKEDREKKEEQHRIDEAMRERLIAAGLSGREIENIMDREKKKNSTTTTTTTTTLMRSNALEPFHGHQPVYAKISTEHLSVETLRYYDIPYEYDHDNPNYIIVLREMSQHETNILFDHTKALRAGRLLLEAPKKDKPDYAFYRKRDRSKSRGRGDGEWKKFGILEYKR